MTSNTHKGQHCQNLRMRMTAVSLPLLSGSQVKSEVFMPYYLIIPASSLLCLFSLHRPQRSHWGSSHLPRAVNRGGAHLWECQLCRGQGKKLRSTVHSYLFPHILWIHDHTCAASIETMNHPCQLQPFRLNCDNSCSDINGGRSPLLIFTLSWFHGGFMYIFDNFIFESIMFLSVIISNLLDNLKLISLAHTLRGDWTHILAYKYIIIWGLKLWFIFQKSLLEPLQWEACYEWCSTARKVRGLETEEDAKKLLHSSQST